jgi:UDP-glucuronate decarboxylase
MEVNNINIFINNPIIQEDMKAICKVNLDWGKLNNKTVLITGANGMLASYFVFTLLYLNKSMDANIKIICCVRNLSKGNQKFEGINDPNFILYKHDIVVDEFDFGFNIDFIVHAASLASPQFYGQYPVETILPNIVGTYKILEYCKENSVSKVLFLSSGEIYGNVENTHLIEENNYGLIDYFKLGNFYSVSKITGEILLSAYYNEYSIPVNSARIFHSYGPTMDISKDVRVFSEFVRNIVDGENIMIKSDGLSKRAFSYITDTISGLFFILLNGESGESYNVGNPNEFISIKNLAEIITQINNKCNEIIIQPRKASSIYTPNTKRNDVNFSVEKLSKLGWRATIDIVEGFTRTIVFFKESKKLTGKE